MSQSDFIILGVCFLGFSCIGYFLFILTRSKEKRELNNDGNAFEGREDNRHRQRRVAADNNDVDENLDAEFRNVGHNGETDLSGLSRKEMAKIEKKRARAQHREAMEAAIEERKEREEARMQLLREQELEKEEEFRLKEEERLRLKAIEEKRQQDSYNHWKDPYTDNIVTFSTSEMSGKIGPAHVSPVNGTVLLAKIEAIVKNKKQITLLELSQEVGIPLYNCYKILHHLQSEGILSGNYIGTDGFFCIDETASNKISSYINNHGEFSASNAINLAE